MMLAHRVTNFQVSQVVINFLTVGHTHEDIDQLFGTISGKLMGRAALSPQELVNVIRSYTPKMAAFEAARAGEQINDWHVYTEGGMLLDGVRRGAQVKPIVTWMEEVLDFKEWTSQQADAQCVKNLFFQAGFAFERKDGLVGMWVLPKRSIDEERWLGPYYPFKNPLLLSWTHQPYLLPQRAIPELMGPQGSQGVGSWKDSLFALLKELLRDSRVGRDQVCSNLLCVFWCVY
jgi:hypothetical protein